MSYYLGIDLGTTYTAAAIERGGTVEALTLGNRTASVPSVIFLRDDGEFLLGEAATRRAATDPGRVSREFKRRVGDPTPIILGGTPFAAEMLMARVARWTVDRVQEQQGGAPQGIALTHPANWGPYKLDLLNQAVRQVDIDVDLTLAEPVAAATFYASQRRLDPGAVVAVYDLGGGTFDAAMVRRTSDGFETIGNPEGIERLGGIDFDEAVVAHVRGAIGDAFENLDPEEPAAVAAVARLRQECIDAKEALSSDTDVSIPVLLPNLQTEVRLTRSEFENMIRPAINETIVALRRAVRSAKVGNDEISAVLLVGGSSRIPLVAQMVATELGRPIAIDAHPKDAISFGAAIAVAQRRGQATPESVRTVLPSDQRPPPPTMVDTGRPRPAPPVPRPAPPGGATVGPGAAGGAVAASAAGLGAGRAPDPRPAPPAGGAPRPAPPTTPASAPRSAPPSAPSVPAAPAAHAGGPAVGGHPGAGAPAAPGQAPGAAGASPPRGVQPAPVRHPAPGGPPPRSPGAPMAGAAGLGAAPAPPPGRPAPPGGAGAPPPAYRAPQGPSGAPAHYRSAGYPSGGHGSGGFPAARQAQSNRGLWALIGVVAVIAVVLVAAVLLRGNDDGGGTASDGDTPSDETDEATGYSAEVEADFIDGCTSTAGETTLTEATCQCAYDRIVAEVPFEEFRQLEADLAETTDTSIPQSYIDIVEGCIDTTG